MQKQVKKRRLRCFGFTLVEMMIVVAIIAALAALAVPQYQNYMSRTQFSEALTLFSGVRTAVETHVTIYGVNSALRADEFLAGHRTQGEHISGISVINAGQTVQVVLTFKDDGVNMNLASEEVTFSWDTAEINEGWQCSVSDTVKPFASGMCASAG
ncbi:pilin [Halorhodospira halochloris]|uniref:pilin n=1 Tax=Halorhodospira halochloris TaxID=1052 RepID=UPI0023792922|nr:pilin [Halorhodospira halochloris]